MAKKIRKTRTKAPVAKVSKAKAPKAKVSKAKAPKAKKLPRWCGISRNPAVEDYGNHSPAWAPHGLRWILEAFLVWRRDMGDKEEELRWKVVSQSFISFEDSGVSIIARERQKAWEGYAAGYEKGREYGFTLGCDAVMEAESVPGQ